MKKPGLIVRLFSNRKKNDMISSWRAMVIVALFFIGTHPHEVASRTRTDPVPALSIAQKRQIETDVRVLVQDRVNRQRRLPGQRDPIFVQVALDETTRNFTVDLSRNYVPTGLGQEFEDYTRQITTGVYEAVFPSYPMRSVLFRYGGKSIYHYHPEENSETSQRSSIN